MNTKLKGDITELEVLTRIQIKSPRILDGKFEISCKSTNRGNGRYIQHPYNEDEIDAIVTFFEGDCYFIPVKDINKASIQLRLNESKNGQKSKIKFAKEYKIEKYLKDTMES